MDINIVKENLKKDYQCQLVTIINYANYHFAKAFEFGQGRPLYRYFKVLKDNHLEEITDELLLAYFKEMNEIHEVNNY